MFASREGHITCAEALIRAGADISAVSKVLMSIEFLICINILICVEW